MSSKHVYIVLVFLALPVLADAQFLNLQIDIDPEVDTRVMQPLDFGQLLAGSGVHEITLGSPNMGVFYLRALRTQEMFVSLEYDEELRHSNPRVSSTIPIELFANYTGFGVDDYRESTPMSSLLEPVVIEGPPDNPQSTWSGMYIYIYGAIDLGNIPAGSYRGEVVLTVIYN